LYLEKGARFLAGPAQPSVSPYLLRNSLFTSAMQPSLAHGFILFALQFTDVLMLAEAASGLRGDQQNQAAKPGVGTVKDVASLLPYRPANQPEAMFKSRCINFLNQALEKGGYKPDLVLEELPKCHWKQNECKALEEDLTKRLGTIAGGPAAAPAPSPAAPASALVARGFKASKSSVHQGTLINQPSKMSPPINVIGEELYGWCDVMYNMLRTKAVSEMKE